MAANSYELNNLNNDALDAPVYNTIPNNAMHQYGCDNSQDFTSLPCETFLVACRTANDFPPGGSGSGGGSFRHMNPLYQSAHVQLTSPSISDDNASVAETGKIEGILILTIQTHLHSRIN